MKTTFERRASHAETAREMDRWGSIIEQNEEYISRLKKVIASAEDEITALRAENERLRAALEPFACTCSVKGMGAGGNCTKGSGECMCWNARAAINDQPAPGKGE